MVDWKTGGHDRRGNHKSSGTHPVAPGTKPSGNSGKRQRRNVVIHSILFLFPDFSQGQARHNPLPTPRIFPQCLRISCFRHRSPSLPLRSSGGGPRVSRLAFFRAGPSPDCAPSPAPQPSNHGTHDADHGGRALGVRYFPAAEHHSEERKRGPTDTQVFLSPYFYFFFSTRTARRWVWNRD